jgi:hypothetical protein
MSFMQEASELIPHENLLNFYSTFCYFPNMTADAFTDGTKWYCDPHNLEKLGYVTIDGPYTGDEINRTKTHLTFYSIGSKVKNEIWYLAILTEKGKRLIEEYRLSRKLYRSL